MDFDTKMEHKKYEKSRQIMETPKIHGLREFLEIHDFRL